MPGLINPFALGEDPLVPNPPLDCTHGDDACGCHVDVDGAEEMFRRFQETLNMAGDLQRRGLFVAVHGPTGCGKTSLVNRCAHWAERTLGTRTSACVILDLRAAGRSPRLSSKERLRKVGKQLVADVQDNNQLLKTFDELKDVEGDLDDVTRVLARRLKQDVAVIVLLPRTEHRDEVVDYWASTRPKFLAIAECTANLHVSDFADQGTVHSLLLEMGFLRTGDGAIFSAARLDRPGRGEMFPDLDLNAPEKVLGRSTIATMQTTLYLVYDHFRLTDQMPNGSLVQEDDLARLLRELGG